MYGLHFREELDEPIQRELDALIARLKAFLLQEHNEDGTHNFDLGQVSDATITAIIDRYQNEGQYWKTGPWVLDDPSSGNKHIAAVRDDPTAGTHHNYAPVGIDTAVVLNLEPQGDITITGIKALEGAQQDRFLFFRNRDSGASITMLDDNAGSIEQYRFDFGLDVVVGPDQAFWLYYDSARERWTATLTGLDAGPIPVGDPSTNMRKAQFEITIDGNGSTITTGAKKIYARVPFDFELNGWEIVGDQNGSIVFDVWKDTYANFPPTVGDTIIGGGGTKPTVSGAAKATSANVNFYTTDWDEGDYIEVKVDSVTSFTKVNLFLYGRKAN